MKKTVKLGIAVLSSLVLLCSCSEEPNKGTSENYEIANVKTEGNKLTDNKYVEYTFEYPKDWAVLRNDGMISVQSDEDNPNERVTISCTAVDSRIPDITVNDYWYGKDGQPGYYKQMQETIGGDFKEISKKEVKLGNTGAPALRVTYNAKVADKTYKISQVVSVISGSVYTFTYTALPERFDHWEAAFTHAVTSFQFK